MTRNPAVAGRFYPSDREDLIDIIESCFCHELGPGTVEFSEGARTIKSAVVPHAGYLASGMIAAHVFSALAKEKRPEAYVVVGPDHYGIPFDYAVCPEPYLTPFGECPMHEEILKKLEGKIPFSVRSHRHEHSVEVVVPFIQYIDPKARIIPIIMRNQSMASAERLASAIREACEGFDTVFIASSDLSHYIPDNIEKMIDRKYLEHVSSMNVEGMYRAVSEYDLSVCGNGPIATAIMFSPECRTVKILKHSNSWESLQYDKNAVVGYASALILP